MKIAKIAAALAVAAVTSMCAGCASVMESAEQPVQVATTPEQGADCLVFNDRGQWHVTSPGAVTIKKSASVLSIVCSKPGYKDGKVYAAPRMSKTALVGMMLPYAGMLNAAVDSGSGAAQYYDTNYIVNMAPMPGAAAATTPAPVAATTAPAPAAAAAAPAAAAPAKSSVH